MELHPEVTKLMGQKAKYCRAKLGDDGKTKLFIGEGIIVGVIIGTSRRIQIMIRDDKEKTDAAFSLDLLCINPTDADAKAYFEHHKSLKKIVNDHNEAQQAREKVKIKEVDDINADFFGRPLDV